MLIIIHLNKGDINLADLLGDNNKTIYDSLNFTASL